MGVFIGLGLFLCGFCIGSGIESGMKKIAREMELNRITKGDSWNGIK